MSHIDVGGSAFPTVNENLDDEYGSMGMTLRDYFAAKAMQALIAASMNALSKAYAKNPDAINPIIAQASYEMAKAMLKAREA